MKVSHALERVILTMMYGANVPEVFRTMDINNLKELMQWILEIENAEHQNVEIDMSKAPKWFCELVRGNRIEAIKDVRNQLPHVVTYVLNITPKEGYTFLPNLKPTKDFVENMQDCIVVPASPLKSVLTSA